MATLDLATDLATLPVPAPLGGHARLHGSETVIQLLADVACAPALALVVDLEALERSPQAGLQRLVQLVLDALSQVRVQVVLAASGLADDCERCGPLHHALPGSWCVDRRTALAEVRERIAGAQLIAISDDLAWLGALTSRDCGIALAVRPSTITTPAGPIAAVGDVSMRAALWWLVDVRARAGMTEMATLTLAIDASVTESCTPR